MLLQIKGGIDMSWKTKAILNYIVSLIFLGLMVEHIFAEKSVLRVICDIIPLLWFGIYGSFCFKKHLKTKR